MPKQQVPFTLSSTNMTPKDVIATHPTLNSNFSMQFVLFCFCFFSNVNLAHDYMVYTLQHYQFSNCAIHRETCFMSSSDISKKSVILARTNKSMCRTNLKILWLLMRQYFHIQRCYPPNQNKVYIKVNILNFC